MTISVVIPTYNRRDLLASVLQSIFAQDFPRDEREVVVVVDGSTDGTAESLRNLAAPCRFAVIEQPNRGPAAARNAGVRAAAGDIVLFLDDDIRCAPDLLSLHVAAHAKHGSSVVFGPVFIAPESPQNPATDWVSDWYSQYNRELVERRGPWSKHEVWLYSNCSIPRKLFLDIGGYNESFPWAAYEDGEIAIRLWDAGVAFRYEPAARVYQVYDKTPETLVKKDAVRHARAEVMMARIHPSHRPHSRLARANSGHVRRILTRLAWQSPVSPELLLRAPFKLAASARRISAMNRAAVRLLQLRMGIEAVRAAIDETGSWSEVRRQYGATLPILVYHDIGAPALGTYPEQTVSPAKFEQQVKWLARRGYTGIGIRDWLAWREEGKPLPDKPVLFTFDDGYQGVSKYAFPILERYGFKALAFVVTSLIGMSNAWDEAAGFPSRQLMSADDIRQWARRGFEFGSHSRTHADLTGLGADEMAREVAASRDELGAVIGDAPAAFAYPYGRVNYDVRRCVAKHFAAAVSMARGLNTIATDPHMLRRSHVRQRDTLLDLACRAAFGTSPIVKLRSYLPAPLGFDTPKPAALSQKFLRTTD